MSDQATISVNTIQRAMRMLDAQPDQIINDPVYLSAALFDAARARGADMRAYRRLSERVPD